MKTLNNDALTLINGGAQEDATPAETILYTLVVLNLAVVFCVLATVIVQS